MQEKQQVTTEENTQKSSKELGKKVCMNGTKELGKTYVKKVPRIQARMNAAKVVRN